MKKVDITEIELLSINNFNIISNSDITTSNGSISISENTNIVATFGKTKIGKMANLEDWVGFSHKNNADGLSYALIQHPDGRTVINTKESQYISFNINNKEKMKISEYKDDEDNYHGTIEIPKGNIKISDTYALMNPTGSCKIYFNDGKTIINTKEEKIYLFA